MTRFIVQGTFDLSKNQLIFNFDNISQLLNKQTHSLLLSQQSNNQEIFLQKPTFIQKHSLRFGSSALGLAGGVGLLVSCIWSVLLPAIGSIGVISIACLVNRKITPLHTKELPLEVAKSQSLFAQQIVSGVGNTGDLSSSTTQTKFENPDLLSTNEDKPNIPPPPPPPSIQKGNQRASLISADLQAEIHKGKELKVVLPPTGSSMLPNDELLLNIRKGKELKSVPNFEKMKEVIESSSSSSLLKVLQYIYERALNVSKTEKNQVYERYLEGKLENFKDKFPLKDISAKESLELENVSKYIETSASLTESMKWIQNLLRVLSNHKDLTEENKEYFFSEYTGSTQISLTGGSRSSLLLDIHTKKKLKHTLNLEKINEIVQRFSPNGLLKTLQSAYEGALNISINEKKQYWKNYFENKVKTLDKLPLEEDKNLTVENAGIEDVCKKAKDLNSLWRSMKLIQNLLCVLSNHKDLNDKDRKYYSEKLEHVNEHINKLGSGGNPMAEGLLERADAMAFSDNNDSDNDVNDSDWD